MPDEGKRKICAECLKLQGQLDALKDAVNTFPLGLLISGEGDSGKVEHRFINLIQQRTSPAYPNVVEALLAAHTFYKASDGFILEMASISQKLPGPMEPGECDG